MLIHNLLENSANRHPDKVAVIQDADRVTYNQLNTRANILAKHLLQCGISQGDRVAIILENNLDYVTAYYATLKAGAVVSSLNPGLKPDGLQQLLNHLEPTAIITNFKAERLLKAIDLSLLKLNTILIRTPKQKWPNMPFAISALEEIITDITDQADSLYESNVINDVRTIAPSPPGERAGVRGIDPNTLAAIIYTSGSTGEPKGVMLSHANIVANTRSICQYLNITHMDIQMVVLPFFYVMGKSLLNTHIAAGATVVLNNRFMYPADVVNQMITEKISSFSGVPSTYAYLLNRSPFAESRDKLPHLRYCSQAGGHMASSLKKHLRSVLPAHTQIYIMYGATEASARLTYLPPGDFESKINSIGKPIPDVKIRIVDEKGREVTDGSSGELVAYGPNIMLGYWKDPQDTARVLKDQGYHTGDIGYRDPDGFLYVSNRKDGLVKVGGHRINPAEIEEFLLSTDLLIETAVVGVPDKLLGNRLTALIVPKDDTLAPDVLLERCAAALPKHKLPSAILPTRALPKGPSGKIDREKCIEIAAGK